MATYTRLPDETLGVRGPASEIIPGKVVQVRRKDGQVKDETILAVVGPAPKYVRGPKVFRGPEVLASIVRKGKPQVATPSSNGNAPATHQDAPQGNPCPAIDPSPYSDPVTPGLPSQRLKDAAAQVSALSFQEQIYLWERLGDGIRGAQYPDSSKLPPPPTPSTNVYGL